MTRTNGLTPSLEPTRRIARGRPWSTQQSPHPVRGRRPPALEPAQDHAAQVDHRLLHGAAADLADRPAGVYPALYSMHLATLNKSMERFVGLSNFTFLFKRETFWMVVQQSCIFAITAVALQGADRLHRRPLRAQHPGQGPAQVARHAAGAVGHSAGDELPRLAVAVRSLLQRLQLGPGAVRHRPHSLDRRCQLGALLGDPGQHLDRRAVLHDHVSGRAQVGARAALRGGRDRRRQLVAAHAGT